jgi:hypothetical protein
LSTKRHGRLGFPCGVIAAGVIGVAPASAQSWSIIPPPDPVGLQFVTGNVAIPIGKLGVGTLNPLYRGHFVSSAPVSLFSILPRNGASNTLAGCSKRPSSSYVVRPSYPVVRKH